MRQSRRAGFLARAVLAAGLLFAAGIPAPGAAGNAAQGEPLLRPGVQVARSVPPCAAFDLQAEHRHARAPTSVVLRPGQLSSSALSVLCPLRFDLSHQSVVSTSLGRPARASAEHWLVVSSAAFGRLLGLRMPQPRLTGHPRSVTKRLRLRKRLALARRPRPAPPRLLVGAPGMLVLGAYLPSHGPLQVYEGLAERYAGRGAAVVLANTRSTSRGLASFRTWAARVRTDPGGVPSDQPPSVAAWTPLEVQTVPFSDAYQSMELTISTYRLNDINSSWDWYMVSTELWDSPNYQGCNYNSQCGPYELARSVDEPISSPTTLFDYEPTSTVSDETSASFTIGGGLSGGTDVGAGVQASWTSPTWSQPSVTTADHSSKPNGPASWAESFSPTPNYSWWPTGGPSPTQPPAPVGTASSAYQSYQAAIFEVPEGTTVLPVTVMASSTTETDSGWYDCNLFWVCWSESFDPQLLGVGLFLFPPSFSVSPSSLTLAQGSSATLSLTDYIPGSSQGLAWQASTTSGFILSPPSKSTSAAITVTQQGAVTCNDSGPAGYVYIDTNPSYAAPSVESGEISTPIYVPCPPPSTTTTTSPPPTTTTTLSGYSYSASWQGATVALRHVPNQTVESLPDATLVGQVGNFETNDATYSCLNGETINVFTAPAEFPGDYVVHNGLQGSQCAYGTWTFPQ